MYRPKLWWKDGVDRDIENIRGQELEVALNRDEWAKLFKKARAH